MRKIWLAVALVAMAGCDSATATEQRTVEVREAPAAPLAVVSTTVEEMSIVSVRRVVQGLYIASAINTRPGGDTRILVRRNALSLGFQTLTSGTLVHNEVRSTGEEMPFMVSAGYRYLVIAAPTTAEGEDDMVRATYVEFTT